MKKNKGAAASEFRILSRRHIVSTKLKEIFRPILPPDELELLVGSYDVVGDIAVVTVPDELRHREKLISEAILSSNGRLKVVAKKTGIYGGEFRTVPLQVIGGEKRTETEVKEFGIRLRVDLSRTYYSVRSGAERKRIASLVAGGEHVLVLFSGIGPYPLIISRYSKAERIVGVEKNPVAHRYAQQNLAINKDVGNIELVCGDAKEVSGLYCRPFDRVIMPLPRGGERFLAGALDGVRSGGTIHYYQMQSPDGFQDSIDMVAAAAGRAGRKIICAQAVRCGHCGPKSYRICVDAKIS
ncbi:class I SAM-dependent methyltransferase [Desulforhopalus singaporensis]|uniref:Methyltransferase n=1 Tax=Desulforhopalus singaporensis TaxID=91360 RepID=A0A1H0TST0_9BACT|nr:hypothetical protein [Desulforhopalus singaporensis]SDP57087.1 methyltransferase [Desulforhopalus singaporensis]